MDFGSHGSANLNNQRSDLPPSTKIPKLDFGFRSNLWPPDDDDDDIHNMLSFAPPAGAGIITFSNQDHLCNKRGLSLNNGGGRGGFGRMKGPFTPSQWMELEHQALIYKHLVANVPVPSHLLVSLRTSLSSYGSSFVPNILGWGPFQVYGAGGSTDPEPGRCRRTDGKKWRCSRDAVPDQKYCERHINRGRHRSRKPVEANTTTTTAATSNVAAGTPGTASGGGSTAMPRPSGVSTNNPIISRSRGFQGLSLLPPQTTTTSTATTATTGPKLKEAAAPAVAFPIQKQSMTLLPFDELSTPEFGIVLSDYTFLNPSERIPYVDHSNSFLQFNENDDPKDPKNNQHPVHQFIDDWPKAQSQCQSGPWPDELKSDWTQLSMSIPVAPDFSSSSSSPAQEKSTMAIPRLAPMSLDLGVRKSSWLPVNWGKSMGGPLGEVLISSTTTTTKGGENLNWTSSPQMGSSPSGVLQKSNLVSLSNSSSASSPEAEKARLSNGFLDSAHAN